MPKLAIGTPAIKSARGFTLIEILVVVLIIGIITTIAMLSFGDFGERRKIRAIADNFAQIINLAKTEAILESQTYAIKVQPHNYQVLRYQNDNTWLPASANIFKNHKLPHVLLIMPNQRRSKNMITIHPSGDISPFKLQFAISKDEIIATVSGNHAGKIEVQYADK